MKVINICRFDYLKIFYYLKNILIYYISCSKVVFFHLPVNLKIYFLIFMGKFQLTKNIFVFQKQLLGLHLEKSAQTLHLEYEVLQLQLKQVKICSTEEITAKVQEL